MCQGGGSSVWQPLTIPTESSSVDKSLIITYSNKLNNFLMRLNNYLFYELKINYAWVLIKCCTR